ncbi:hypothetical protein AVEN_25318-1 [Araneus ventricosus]|uniref:Uncharacterized protein n=1 Tax=Araneus ventricosus TaxID=182803 RepID=A0A4Y2IQW0_ARAVE|nr:hypothetical protein AVEN_25318-1 [Araneus ventricosus]
MNFAIIKRILEAVIPMLYLSKLKNKAAYVNIAPIVPTMKPLLITVIFQTVRQISLSKVKGNLCTTDDIEVSDKFFALEMKFFEASLTDIADVVVTMKDRNVLIE